MQAQPRRQHRRRLSVLGAGTATVLPCANPTDPAGHRAATTGVPMSKAESNKATIRRLVDQVLNAGQLDVVDELYAPELAPAAKRWIAPFRAAFPDLHMQILELISEGDTVAGRFWCSGTLLGPWRAQPPTGRRFERIDEVGIYRLRDGRIVQAWSLEDTLTRMQQLGLAYPQRRPDAIAAQLPYASSRAPSGHT